MAKDVVKDVRLLQVIQFLLGADEGPGWKTPVGEMIEEHLVGHESGYGNDTPAGNLFKAVAQLFHVRDAAIGQRERVHHRKEFVTRTVLQCSKRAAEQTIPTIMLGG